MKEILMDNDFPQRTIALRFGEHLSPPCGTIQAHEEMIKQNGFVWYGKMTNPISKEISKNLLKQENSKILLINSGKYERFWASIIDISFDTPELLNIPQYYRNLSENFKTWFKVVEFKKAPNNIMSQYIVSSSGNKLNDASRHSMSPYFIIERI